MATDEELIAAVASGDGRRLEELCRRWERPLYQLIARHTGGRDVEDLYQETWLRGVRAARRFDPGRRFSTWLFQIAINLCPDWRRGRSPPPARRPAPARPRRPTPSSTPAACSPRSPRRSGTRSSCATTTIFPRRRWRPSSAARGVR